MSGRPSDVVWENLPEAARNSINSSLEAAKKSFYELSGDRAAKETVSRAAKLVKSAEETGKVGPLAVAVKTPKSRVTGR